MCVRPGPLRLEEDELEAGGGGGSSAARRGGRWSKGDELSVLRLFLRDDRWLLELATSPMCNFEGRAKSVGPVGTVFAAKM